MIKRMFRNSGSEALLYALRLGFTFLMTPLIVKALGNHDYGIYEIVMAVTGYMGLLEMGIQPAVEKYVAQYFSSGNNEKLHDIYKTSVIFISLIGLIIFVFFAIWALSFPEILAKEPTETMRYTWYLLIVGGGILVSFPLSIALCFLQGFQKFHVKNIVTAFTVSIGCSIIIVLLQRGYGLVTLVLVNTIGMTVKLIVFNIIIRLKSFGGFGFKRGRYSWPALKELLVFGFQNLLQGIAARISMASDSVVIGYFLKPETVPFFVIPANFTNHFRNLGWVITGVFMPMFSEVDAKGNKLRSTEVYLASSRVVTGLTILMAGGIFFLGVPFISRWMGAEYAEKGKWVLYIFLGVNIVPWLHPLSGRFLTGIGRQERMAKIKVVAAIMNLCLSLLLVQFYGIEGVALGTLIPVLICEPLILLYTCSLCGVTVFHYINKVLVPHAVPILSFFIILYFLKSHLIIDTYTDIFGSAIISSIVYLILFFYFALKKDERALLVNKIKQLTQYKKDV